MTTLRWLLVWPCFAGVGLAQSPATVPDTDPLAPAQALFKLGKFSEAAAAYRAIAGQDRPSSQTQALAYAGMVRSYLKTDDVPAAEESSTRALAALPQSALVHAVRGDVLFRKGLMDEAEHEYTAALKMDQKCARAWLGKGKIDAIASRKKLAEEAYTRAHELDPEDSDIVFRWAVHLPYPQNVAELDKFISQYHSDADDERRKRDYLEFVRALAGRKTWIPAKDVAEADIKLETLLLAPTRIRGGGLRVKFNDSRSSTLLLDTGASGVTITRKLAEKIGARKLSEHGLEGVGDAGPASGYFAWVDKIAVGDLEFHDCTVLVTIKGDVGGEDGVIGADIFSKYLVTIDFPGHRFRLSPLPRQNDDHSQPAQPPGAESQRSFTKFFSFGHLLLLPTRVGDSASGLFAVDTGAYVNSISPALAKQVSKLHDSNVAVRGISGQVKQVYATEKATLQFSHLQQPNEDLITFDLHQLSRNLETEVSGFIGYATLNGLKIMINYRDGLVDFEYKP